jgi:hypothetical protein
VHEPQNVTPRRALKMEDSPMMTGERRWEPVMMGRDVLVAQQPDTEIHQEL